MKKHLTNEILASHIAGLNGYAEAAKIGAHIAECEMCGEKYMRILSLTNPYLKEDKNPGPGLRQRIMNSYAEILDEEQSKSAVKGLIGNFAEYWKPAAAAAVVIIALIFGVIFINTNTNKLPGNISIAMRILEGNVLVNNKPAVGGAIAGESKISTDNNSLIELYYNNVFSIKISGESRFSIDKARASADNNEMEFAFTLLRGTIISRFIHSGKLKYSYKTPKANIDSIGTEFLLQASGESTLVVMKEGSVRIQPAGGKQAVESSPDNKYIVTNSVETKPAERSDFDEYNSIGKRYETAVKELNPGTGKTPDYNRKENSNKKNLKIKSADYKKLTIQAGDFKNPDSVEKSTGDNQGDAKEVKRENNELRKELKEDRREMRKEDKPRR